MRNLIHVYGVLGTIMYFYFTQKRTGTIGVSANVGKWVMIIAFGSAFCSTVLGRMPFLLVDWLKLIK